MSIEMTKAENIEALKTEVKQVIIALDLIAAAAYPVTSFGDAYKQVGINFSLEACDLAAEITGYARTFCKMLNYKFRMDAANMMFERALAEVAGFDRSAIVVAA